LKIRKGFVSNSSSSSFICDVCGEAVSGMDMSLDEAEMYECENGHTFCRDHATDKDELEEKLNKLAEDDEEDTDSYYDAIYKIAEKYCPCCTFETVSPYDLTDCLLKKVGMSKEDVAKELRERFADFNTFSDYLKEG